MPRRFTEYLHYDSSARRTLGIWAMLFVGVMFAWVGSVIDPLDNCNSSRECAPWLIPVARWMGIAFATAAAGMLMINPRRGSHIDRRSGNLVWWQGRTATHPGDGGAIHPSQISRIRIVRQSEASDAVHLYDRNNDRQPYFDEEVIPWPYDQWAKKLIARWPHIVLEIEG